MYRSTYSFPRYNLEEGGQFHASGALLPRKELPVPIGGWVVLRTGEDDVERRRILLLPGLELRPLGRLARTTVAIPTVLTPMFVL
jgi:hypothetical protein